MLKRLLTAGIGIPITFLIFWSSSSLSELPMLALLFTVSNIINIEIWQMTRHKKDHMYPLVLINLFILLISVVTYLYGLNYISLLQFLIIHGASAILFFLLVFVILFSKEEEYDIMLESYGISSISYITLVIFFPFLFLLKLVYPNALGILLLFIFCWMSDAFALFVGTKWGLTQLNFLPSKSKTLEGYVGSLVLTSLLGIVFYFLQGLLFFPFQWSLLKWVLFGFTLSAVGSFGDLIESFIKRWAGQKDSSNFLPGMGGFFDAIDAQIYAAPIALLFFLF